MQGTETVYLLHYPMFYEAKHRRQLILSIELPPQVKEDYVAIKTASPEETISFVTAEKVTLATLLQEEKPLFGSIKSNYS